MSLTPKQEKFAQEWFKTGNKTEAYRRAYNCKSMSDNAINVNASKLSADTKVALRYQELQKKAQHKTLVTADAVAAMLSRAFKKAEELNQPAAMSSAAMNLARLYGLDVVSRIQLAKLEKDSEAEQTSKADIIKALAQLADDLPD